MLVKIPSRMLLGARHFAASANGGRRAIPEVVSYKQQLKDVRKQYKVQVDSAAADTAAAQEEERLRVQAAKADRCVHRLSLLAL